MSVQLFHNRAGLFRNRQFRNDQKPDHLDLWPDILRAYRRYRQRGIDRDRANLLTIGYADGRLHGPVLTTMHNAGQAGDE